MLFPETVTVAVNAQNVGSLGDRVMETADPLTEPVRLPLEGPFGSVASRSQTALLPVCERVTRAGPLPAAWLLVMVPLQVPLSEGVDGPVGDDEPLQAADAPQATRVSKNANAVRRYKVLLPSEIDCQRVVQDS